MMNVVKRGGLLGFLFVLCLITPSPAFASRSEDLQKKKSQPPKLASFDSFQASDITLTCVNKSKACIFPVKKEEKKKDPVKAIASQVWIAPQPEITKNPEPTPLSNSVTPALNTGLNADLLFSMVNERRAQAGLPPFEKNAELDKITQSRGPELHSEIYAGGGMHAGFQRRNLPYWATENMISQNTETEALQWWLNSWIHRSAILGSYKYASVVCAGNDCAMIFSSMEPKQAAPITPTPTPNSI